MSFKLKDLDIKRLHGVHPDLIRVVERAQELSKRRFKVLEGTRTRARQKQLVKKGASKTMNSRHIPAVNGFGHAVDLAPIVDGKVSWDWKYYYPLAGAIKQAAREEGVEVQWGGDWKSFKDGPHWQLPWKTYTGKKKPLRSSRIMKGSALAGTGGASLLVEPIQELVSVVTEQQDTVSNGSIFSMVVAGVIILGAAYALYARWDDAGRPKLW